MGELVSVELLRVMVALAAPLLVASMGELIIERSGVLNLSIEGQMTLGASVAFGTIFALGEGTSWLVGAIAAVGSSIVIGLLLAYLSVSRAVNQIAVGLGLLIACLGMAALTYRIIVGIPSSPPSVETLDGLRIPVLAEIPVLGRVLFSQPLPAYVALALVGGVAWLLFRTSTGLKLRACGENPRSVDSLGLPLPWIRYAAVITGSGLIGLASAFFVLTIAGGGFSEDIIGGRGWLALLLVIFGAWRPLRIFAGAILFAYLDALRFRLGVTNPEIPNEFLQMLPYIAAAIALASVYGRARAPGALSQPYEREAR